jgi:hypothetical protein
MGAGASTHSGGGIQSASELGTLSYDNISLAAWQGKLHSKTGLPPKFTLLLAYESLDFVDEEGKTLVQFPYQVIISWGYTHTNFRFTLPAKAVDSSTNSPLRTTPEPVTISVNTPRGVAQEIDSNIMKTVLKLMEDMKKISTVTADEFLMLKQSIFVQPEPEAEPEDIPKAIAISDTDGNEPETPVVTPEKKISPVEIRTNELKEEWYMTITQFSLSRSFLAKQAMELIQLIGPLAPFERMDLAEMLYDRILNKESFQLVVNAFDDLDERSNLTHRLKLKGFVTDTKLINC